MSTIGVLPSLVADYREMLVEAGELDDEPSCSLAEALNKQDLFINSVLANMGSSFLWQMLRTGIIENRGFFLNLGGLRTQPIGM
ncbi:hypothetical protein [Pedobacter miscanthi]|uniref:hypothetical protein n=1 Tax=Pedobacter miscanthi TaxID=2259170 RepID=UPI00292EFCD2|nr:hypothetical protein [Pedobacter miscanthi]